MKHSFALLLISCVAVLAGTPATDAQPPAKEQIATDIHGDPLSEGALARLGSVRFHHEGGLIAAAFAPDGKSILAAGYGKEGGLSLRSWEIPAGKEIHRLTIKDTSLSCMVLASDGKTVFIGHNDGIRQYDYQNGKLVQSFVWKDVRSSNFAISPDGKLLAVQPNNTYFDPIVHVFDIATGKEQMTFMGHQGEPRKCQWSADGKRILCTWGRVLFSDRSTLKGSLCVWDGVTGKKLHDLEDEGCYDAVFASDGQTAAYLTDKDEARIVEVPTGKLICRFQSSYAFMEFTSDNKRLILSSYKGEQPPCLVDAATGKQILHFERQASQTQRHRLVGLSPDGKMLAAMAGSWNSDGSLLLWDIATGKAIHHDGGHYDVVNCVAFSPEGTILVSAVRYSIQKPLLLTESGLVLPGKVVPLLDDLMAAVDVHGDGPATGTSYDDLGLMLIELGLGGLDGQREVVVVKGGIDDLVAVVLQVRRFDAAWDRLPAVKEKDFHRRFWTSFA